MKIYNTIGDYLKNRKAGDIVVLAGYGIIDGLKVCSKYDTYKVYKKSTDYKLVIKSYRGKKTLTLREDSYDQKICVLSKVEFKNLPV